MRQSGQISEKEHIIEGALKLCAERGWRVLRMADIAREAEMSEERLRTLFANKSTILAAFYDRLERESLALAEDMVDESVRDRLFAIMMERLELAMPYREALRRMLEEGLPKQVLCRSKAWLDKLRRAAGMQRRGGLAGVQTMALGVVWGMVLPVWLKDDSADLAKTMAALDGYLGQAEDLWQTLRRFVPGI